MQQWAYKPSQAAGGLLKTTKYQQVSANRTPSNLTAGFERRAVSYSRLTDLADFHYRSRSSGQIFTIIFLGSPLRKGSADRVYEGVNKPTCAGGRILLTD